MLVAGVALAVFVVKWTQRSAPNEPPDEDDAEAIPETEAPRAEPR